MNCHKGGCWELTLYEFYDDSNSGHSCTPDTIIYFKTGDLFYFIVSDSF